MFLLAEYKPNSFSSAEYNVRPNSFSSAGGFEDHLPAPSSAEVLQ